LSGPDPIEWSSWTLTATMELTEDYIGVDSMEPTRLKAIFVVLGA
jgi:hypothetical protein